MISSWLVYAGVIGISFLLVSLAENKGYINNQRKFNKVLFTIVLSIIVIFCGIRYDVGTDYMSYYNEFIGFKFNSFVDIIGYLENRELIPLIIRYISNNILHNEYIFFFITSLLVVGSIFLSIYKRKRYLPIAYSLLMFLCLDLGASFNAVRQYMAIGLVTIAYFYMEKKEIKKFLLMVILAGLCHSSAYIILMVYPISITKFNIDKIYKSLIIIITIITIFGYNSIIKLISSIDIFSRYSRYLSNDIDIGVGLLLMNIPILLVLLLYGRKLIKYNHSNKIYIFLFILGFLLKNLEYVAPFAGRIAWYFSIAQIFILPQLICIASDKLERFIFKLFIIGYAIFQFVYMYGIQGYHEIFPYTTIFG